MNSTALDLVHPRPEGRARTIAVAVLQDPEEDVLHQVFTGRAITGKPRVEVEERRLIAIEQHGKHFAHTFPNLQHQIFVWKRIGHCAMRLRCHGLSFS
jgi:hypothetical protein